MRPGRQSGPDRVRAAGHGHCRRLLQAELHQGQAGGSEGRRGGLRRGEELEQPRAPEERPVVGSVAVDGVGTELEGDRAARPGREVHHPRLPGGLAERLLEEHPVLHGDAEADAVGLTRVVPGDAITHAEMDEEQYPPAAAAHRDLQVGEGDDGVPARPRMQGQRRHDQRLGARQRVDRGVGRIADRGGGDILQQLAQHPDAGLPRRRPLELRGGQAGRKEQGNEGSHGLSDPRRRCSSASMSVPA